MKVTVTPIKECYINQIVKSDIQNMTKAMTIEESHLFWCNGLLFYVEDAVSLFKIPKLFLNNH